VIRIVSIEVKYLIQGEIYSDSFVKLELEVKERDYQVVKALFFIIVIQRNERSGRYCWKGQL